MSNFQIAKNSKISIERVRFCRTQFKAAPVDKKVLAGAQGIKHVPKLPVTQPLPVSFATDKRVGRLPTKTHEEEVEVTLLLNLL